MHSGLSRLIPELSTSLLKSANLYWLQFNIFQRCADSLRPAPFKTDIALVISGYYGTTLANSHLKLVRLAITSLVEDDQALIPTVTGSTFAAEFFARAAPRHLVPRPALLTIQVYELDPHALRIFCPLKHANGNYSCEPHLQRPRLLHCVEVNFTKTLTLSWVPMCHQGPCLVQLAHKNLTHGSQHSTMCQDQVSTSALHPGLIVSIPDWHHGRRSRRHS